MMRHSGHDREQVLRDAGEVLVDAAAVRIGDLIGLTIGEPVSEPSGEPGGASTIKIVKVGEHCSNQ